MNTVAPACIIYVYAALLLVLILSAPDGPRCVRHKLFEMAEIFVRISSPTLAGKVPSFSPCHWDQKYTQFPGLERLVEMLEASS